MRKDVGQPPKIGRLDFKRKEKKLKLEIQKLNIKLATIRKRYVAKRERDFNKMWGVKRGDRIHIETSHFAYDVFYNGFVFDLEDANLNCTDILDDGSKGTRRRYVSGVVKDVKRIDLSDYIKRKQENEEMEIRSKRKERKSCKRVLGEEYED